MGIIGGPANRNEPQLVANLMLPSLNQWNGPLINHLFDEPVSREVLNIPLSSTCNEDRLIWTATAQGQYSVKSAYHSLSSSIQPSEPIWKRLWTLKTVPKLRFFLWSVYHNALPTKTNLFNRHISPDPTCTLCSQRAPESIEHLLLLCP